MKSLLSFHALTQQLHNWQRRQQPMTLQNRTGIKGLRHNRKNCSSAIFVIAAISLTGVMGQRFYHQPKLSVGTIAPQTIKAPFEADFEDAKSTQAMRQAARIGSVPVLMLDPAINQQINQDLEQALAVGNKIRQMVGQFPFTSTDILSTSTQLYLRACLESDWQAILNATSIAPSSLIVHPLEDANKSKVMAELQAYRSKTSSQNFSDLIATISQVRQRYAQGLKKISEPEVVKAAIADETFLLELTDTEWSLTQSRIRDSAKRILAQGIAPGLQPKILQEAVSLQVKIGLTSADTVATGLLLGVLVPNLKADIEQTKQQGEIAAAAVQPVMLHVHKHQVIVRAGEVINQQNFVKLDYFGLSRREINWLRLMQLACVTIVAVGVYGLVEQRFYPKSRQGDRLLVLLLTLSTPLLITVGVPFTNLPAIGLLLGSFYGSPLGVTVVGLLTLLLQGSLHLSYSLLLPSAAGGLLGSWMAGRLRSREELALLGGAIGLTQAVVYLLVNLILSTTFFGSWYFIIRSAALCGLSGLAWSIVALGVSPYLEHLFDLVTASRLAELANPNRPLLKRLAAVAPGTFQHTMFVATLAEAAAKALECNVELVRAGTLYHDIGKMHDPLGFIENQMGGPNKHDEINDPWKSAEIIKKHVSEGLVIARKYRLPTAVQAFIPEHQGTMLIAYFYHQAQQLVDSAGVTRSVLESDFRYDGPIPQSRETGIVMLADSCEAALRSLKDACPEQALSMVNKIFRARWQDNQLVNCGFTRDELSQLAEIFVQVWQQFHHKRIAYPKMIVK